VKSICAICTSNTQQALYILHVVRYGDENIGINSCFVRLSAA
jgi:hypothetical protein